MLPLLPEQLVCNTVEGSLAGSCAAAALPFQQRQCCSHFCAPATFLLARLLLLLCWLLLLLLAAPACCCCCCLQVPFRRVHLTNGNHFDLYDTSGPQVSSRDEI